MAIFSLQTLKNRITDRIHENRARAITGVDLQEILHDVVDSLAGATSTGEPLPSEADLADYGLIGTLDGSNRFFSTSQDYLSGTTRVYLNGIRQFKGGDYTEEGNRVICFAIAPRPGDQLIADYKY